MKGLSDPDLKPEPELQRIGQRLRSLRELYGLSLHAVAERTELSAAYLSQLENSKAIPSLKVLQRLGDSFGKSITYFFEDARGEEPICYFPVAEQVSLSSENGRHIRILAPGAQLNINPVLVTIEPGAGRPDPSSHEGWEFVYVVAGRIRLHIGDRFVDCAAGDAICYNSSLSHLAENIGTEQAVGLWIGFQR